jgi:hypothetical protein
MPLPSHPPRLNYPQILLVLIFVKGSINTRAKVQLEALGEFKISSDLFGIEAHEFSAYNIAPQLTMLLRALQITSMFVYFFAHFSLHCQLLLTCSFLLCCPSGLSL